MSRRVATFCWARVWAVLLSVQLHPRQPVGQCSTVGAKAGPVRPGQAVAAQEPQGLLHAQGLEEETLPHPTAGEDRCGQMEASVGRCEQGKPKPESSPISGGASVSPHRGWGAWQAGEGGGGPHSSGRPPTLAELGWLPERGPGLGSMDTGGRRLMDHPYLPCSCSPHTGSRVYAAEGTGRRVRSRSGKAPSTWWSPQGLRPAHTPCEEGPQEGWLRRSAGQPPSGAPRGSWTPELRAEAPGPQRTITTRGSARPGRPLPARLSPHMPGAGTSNLARVLALGAATGAVAGGRGEPRRRQLTRHCWRKTGHPQN